GWSRSAEWSGSFDRSGRLSRFHCRRRWQRSRGQLPQGMLSRWSDGRCQEQASRAQQTLFAARVTKGTAWWHMRTVARLVQYPHYMSAAASRTAVGPARRPQRNRSRTGDMVRIACVGGGPAGLYFALLMKLSDPRHEITIFEKSRPGATR